MIYDFDQIIGRQGTGSAKWQWFGDGLLPMWVADMDFVSPEPVLQALHDRVTHGVFGYGMPSPDLLDVICERMDRLYNWEVTPEHIIFMPGLVSGINAACRAFGQPGDGVLVQTPVYPPFLSAPDNQNRRLDVAELTYTHSNNVIQYELDLDDFEAAIKPDTRLFTLCNPHNPIGRGFSQKELLGMAEICERHDLIICSDEIHCDLLLNGTSHIPIASLAPEIADRCITLLAPSKTYNIAGLKCGYAIVQNPELRQQLTKATAGLVGGINVMGYAAAQAAYQEGQEWLEQLLAYLNINRDTTVNYIAEHMPDICVTAPAATYLAWLDCRQTGIDGNPQQFFLTEAKVALNDGVAFGSGGEGFVRLNFGCPRPMLLQALDQMRAALTTLN